MVTPTSDPLFSESEANDGWDAFYERLRLIAQRAFRSERRDHTLQPTALVHEAFVRLAQHEGVDWNDPKRSLGIAAQAMRRVLIDHARRRNTLRRGGEALRTALRDDVADTPLDLTRLVALDEALLKLAGLHARQARVVELRLFGGLSVEESASVLDVSERTVKGDWRVAQAWLRKELA